MYTVIKNKGSKVDAFLLGSDHEVIRQLMDWGYICDKGNGRYEVHSQEALRYGVGGEIANAGDWIKVDGSGYPYPNTKQYFEENHRHIEGDTFEQIPKPLQSWDADLEMCPEIVFLMEHKGLIIDMASAEQRYRAELWGTLEVAQADAMIVFYAISYGDNGEIIDADFNFVARNEFERTYSFLSQ